MAEQRRSDRASREGELFRLLVENVVDYAIFVVDAEGLVHTWSHGAERLLGYREGEILGRTADVFYTPEDIGDRVPQRERQEALATGRGDDDRWHVRKDGTRLWVSGVMTPLRDEGGTLRGFAKIMRDRTEWWHAERARREGEERHRAILESITDAFFAVDRGWRFTYLNRQARRLLDPDSRGVIGLDMWQEYPGLAGSVFERAYRRAVEERAATSVTAYYPDHDRWYEVHAYPSEEGLSVYFRDVTGRKRQEEEHARLVAASERQRRTYETALSNTPDFNYIFDLEGRFAYVNAALLGLWRKGLDEAVGRDFFDLGYPPDLAARLQRQIRQVIDTRQPVRDETPYTSHLGERRYEYIFVPVLGAGGAVEAVAGSTRDITERKRAEEALRAGEERFRGLMEQAPFSIQVLSPDGRTLRVNRAWERLWGLTLDQVADYNMLGDPQLEAKGILPHIRRAFAGEAVTVPVIEYDPNETLPDRTRHDDPRRWVSAVAYPLKDAAGRVREVVLVHEDITERRRAEETIRGSEERFRHLADAMPQIVWVTRPDRTVEYVNRRWLDYTGQTTEEALGPGGWAAAVHPEDLGPIVEFSIRSHATGEPFEAEYRIRDASGAYRWHLGRAVPVFDEAGRLVRRFGAATDIDGRRRAEEELRAAKEDAEAANRAKSQFLAVLSHELRTPLNPILLATSSLLERDADPEELRPTLEMIRQNVNLQARLIDDLLDVMRIVRGKMPLHWEVADCHKLIDQAIQICRSEVFGGELRLQRDLAATHRHVNADAARLQQVFWNLIKNAVKFTPEGGTITIRTRDEAGSGGPGDRLVIEVADTGIGIEPEVLPTIWDPFQQGETTITRRFGGLGLGLAICKGVVEAHGGTIAAESGGNGRGTTFRVVLKALPDPVADGDGEPVGVVPEVAPRRPSSLRILVVEDEPATLRLMARLLRGLGHAVTTAGTIASGYEAFEAGEFDLIVSDIGLPDGTGLELMRRVVALRGPIPAIALTGYGMEDDIVRSREAGFTAHMTKPIDFTKLEAMIRQVAN